MRTGSTSPAAHSHWSSALTKGSRRGEREGRREGVCVHVCVEEWQVGFSCDRTLNSCNAFFVIIVIYCCPVYNCAFFVCYYCYLYIFCQFWSCCGSYTHTPRLTGSCYYVTQYFLSFVVCVDLSQRVITSQLHHSFMCCIIIVYCTCMCMHVHACCALWRVIGTFHGPGSFNCTHTHSRRYTSIAT